MEETHRNINQYNDNTGTNENKEIMAVRCNIKVEGVRMKAIVDSGAATSIMTKGLLEELGLEITESSKVKFTITNGQSVPALGKTIIKVEIEENEIPIKVQIIDLKRKDLILGTEWLVKVKGKIDFKEEKLKIKPGEPGEVSMDIFFTKDKIIYKEMEDHENEYEEFEEQELYEEFEKTEEEYESEEEKYEDLDKNPAYYLAELL